VSTGWLIHMSTFPQRTGLMEGIDIHVDLLKSVSERVSCILSLMMLAKLARPRCNDTLSAAHFQVAGAHQ
jgi:hypothetical protein